MPLGVFNLFLAVCLAAGFYRMAEGEGRSGLLWGFSSFMLTELVGYFNYGLYGLIALQVMLFYLLMRSLRSERERGGEV